MEPWQSWGIVILAAVAAYLYYSRSTKFKRGRAQLSSVAGRIQTTESKLPDNSKAQRKRTKNSDALEKNISDVAEVSAASNPTNEKGLKKRKGGKKAGGQPAQSSAVDVSPVPVQAIDSDDAMSYDVDNAEFARQLSELKAGTPLNKPSTVAETRKAKKPGKREEAPPVLVNGLSHAVEGPKNFNGVSTASSTTGADADDDLSPAVSPEFKAIKTPTSGDISDMLEVPKQGPSVLRLTEPAEPQATRQPRLPKPAIEQETKKQRQNKKKNEERKLAREEEEKARRVRLEKQLRTAREAEVRPAKNGLASSQAPAVNAWDKPDGEGASKYLSLTANNDTLLDTFDQPPKAVKNSQNEGGNGNSADHEWKSELPSEEEQMRLLNELDGDGWNTVKKNNRAKKKNGDAGGKALVGDEKGPTADENSSAARWKSTHGINGTLVKGNEGESTNSTTSDSGVDVSQPESTSASHANPSSPVKPPPIDRQIWNRGNIHNHPAYDARYPWALIGHPDDSDWAVV